MKNLSKIFFNNFKKKIIITNFLIFFLMFITADFFYSNFFLSFKKETCYEIEKFFYRLKKNCIGFHKFKSSFPTVKVYTDDLGLRIGKNTKRGNLEKVFIFGDSFTFGVGLDQEKTIVGILENNLKDYDFYNFGVASYSPTIYLFNLEKQVSLNNLPKKIILLLDMTDIYDEAERWSLKEDKPILSNSKHFDEFYKKKNFFHKNFNVTREVLHFINFKIRILKSKVFDKNNYIKTSFQAGFTYRQIDELSDYYTPNNFDLGKKKIKEKINSISKIAKNINSDFYLVIYPYAETLIFGQSNFSWEDFAEEICDNNSCMLINTFDIFKEYKNKKSNWYTDLYFVGDEHFNEGGNKILGSIIIDKIFNK